MKTVKSRINEEIQKMMKAAYEAQAWADQKLFTLDSASGYIDSFADSAGADDGHVTIGNMASTGFDSTNTYKEESHLKCYATFSLKSEPKNVKLKIQKLADAWKILVEDNTKISANFWKIKGTTVEFTIWVK